ncbi:MAG: polysaccharide biosynthesis/export family protein, partial [Verrucomicrobiaceae bacterium]|nr:polysaccharide biosynthesis/export family protein [Verrucomicrobiaceae bacterium]
PEAPQRQAATSQASSNVGTITGAAVLTSMEVLDNSRPIQPGYIISIRILEDRKDAVQQRVAVTGEVQVPYIGLVKAAGRSCRELAYSIKRDLEKSFFITATVVIAIDQVPENPRNMGPDGTMRELDTYVMFGFVMKQGKYDMPMEDLTISQAILRAGGFAQFADVKHVKIVRTTPQGEKKIMVNVDDIMRKGLLQKDVFVRQNDVIIVPEKKINF